MTNRRDFIKAMPIAAGAALISNSVFIENVGATQTADLLRNEHGEYILPPLPYAYDALEPHIDEQTMHLHHDKHHLAYVNGLNSALKALALLRISGNYDLIQYYSAQLSFHGSGHFLHSLFWKNMSPKGGGMAKGELLQAIVKDFGSFEQFKAQFSTACGKIEGSGWGVLAYQPQGRQLFILQIEKHQNLLQAGMIPLLTLDVWEHAYYLKYQNRRSDYITALFNIIDWDDVAGRFFAVNKI